jgi:hypothetical protein
MLNNSTQAWSAEIQLELDALKPGVAVLRQETEELCLRTFKSLASMRHTIDMSRRLIAESHRLIAALPSETALIPSPYNPTLQAEPDASPAQESLPVDAFFAILNPLLHPAVQE